MTYFRTGAPYYHRRAAVSRSCSGWEGVVPAGYGRQALSGEAATRRFDAVGEARGGLGGIGGATRRHNYEVKPHGLLVPVS